MIVFPCTKPTFFDVDDTLIMWNRPSPDDPHSVVVCCPPSTHQFRTFDENGKLIEEGPKIEIPGWSERVTPHKKHIEQLKLHKLRGHTIIVWSAGGWEWAEAAVKTLGLEKFVDLVIEKPIWAYDDLSPNEYMPKSQWMKDE